MTTETTPLLRDAETAAVEDHEVIYDRFPTATKRTILILVSWSAILPSAYDYCSLGVCQLTLGHVYQCSRRGRSYHPSHKLLRI